MAFYLRGVDVAQDFFRGPWYELQVALVVRLIDYPLYLLVTHNRFDSSIRCVDDQLLNRFNRYFHLSWVIRH